jgi:putative ABC transport system ATP-binding protein
MLEIKNLKKSYLLPDGEELPILEIPKWSVEAGEQVVVVGASGCGKTTLLHIIAGILRPSSGHVLIDGWDTPILTEAERDQFRARRIGYVFQTFNLLQGFTALENVMIGMTFAGTRSDRHRAKDLLEKVGLGHRLHHKPAQLSVGEQQRVSVARALANKPKLVLADEPTANVDVGNQQQVIDMLRNTCEEEQVALILVTHAPEVANQFKRVDKLAEINLVVSKRQDQKIEKNPENKEENSANKENSEKKTEEN